MSLVNYSTREITCKIVYYGPGRSGKTTNLQYIHSQVPDDRKGRMISLATETDRTLFFDFLPLELGAISGFQTRFQLYTVPGQVYYDATRKLVLQGADGVVFVADSQRMQQDENLESFRNLQVNLLEQGTDPRTIPLVLQYNKRDLPTCFPWRRWTTSSTTATCRATRPAPWQGRGCSTLCAGSASRCSAASRSASTVR
jgi:signal recognition particle receptor subunit beta